MVDSTGEWLALLGGMGGWLGYTCGFFPRDSRAACPWSLHRRKGRRGGDSRPSSGPEARSKHFLGSRPQNLAPCRLRRPCLQPVSLELEPGSPHTLLTGGAALAQGQGKQASCLPWGLVCPGLGGEGVAHAWPLPRPPASPALTWPRGQALAQPPPGLGLAVPVELVLLRGLPPTSACVLPFCQRRSYKTSTRVVNAVVSSSACH